MVEVMVRVMVVVLSKYDLTIYVVRKNPIGRLMPIISFSVSEWPDPIFLGAVHFLTNIPCWSVFIVKGGNVSYPTTE